MNTRITRMIIVVVATLALCLMGCGSDEDGNGNGNGNGNGDDYNFAEFDDQTDATELSGDDEEAFCQAADNLYAGRIDDAFFDTVCYLTVIGTGNTDEASCQEQTSGCSQWLTDGFGAECLEGYRCEAATTAALQTCYSDLVEHWNQWLGEVGTELTPTCEEPALSADVEFIDDDEGNFWQPFDEARFPASCQLCD